MPVGFAEAAKPGLPPALGSNSWAAWPVRSAASLGLGAAWRLIEAGGEGAKAGGPPRGPLGGDAPSHDSLSQGSLSQGGLSQGSPNQGSPNQGSPSQESPSARGLPAVAPPSGGLGDNRFAEDRFAKNALSKNALSKNGFSAIGLTAIRLTENGLIENRLTENRPIEIGTSQAATIEEGAVRLQVGSGFFRPESRPSRDLGVLLAQHLAAQGRALRPEAPGLSVLDLMAGCGIRSLRYSVEAGAATVWANDADPDRLALLQANLAGLAGGRCTTRTAQKLLAGCLVREQRFDLIDLDAFGCPSSLVPLALEALAFDGVLYLASTDGRSPTGHDRPAAIRSLGAAARAQPASGERAVRVQLGVVARAAWSMGRGVEPLFSFSEGRTFRTAVRLRRKPGPQAERQLGLLAHCHGCGDQQAQTLLQLRRWRPCCCPDQAGATLSISGPLWIGPLQDLASLEAMAAAPGAAAASLSQAGARLLAKLRRDDGLPARCWPMAELAKRLGGGPPALEPLVEALRQQGWSAQVSAVMPAQLRSDAPWDQLLEVAAHVS